MPVHGAAQHTDVTREVFLPANEAYVKLGTPDDKDIYGVVAGGANVDGPRVLFTMKVPDDFVSFTALYAVWVCAAAAGDMHWRLNAQYASSGEAYNIHSYITGWRDSATGGDDIMNVTEATIATLPNIAAGDYLGLDFDRDGSKAADTLDTTMYLLGLLFTYTAEQ